MKFMVPSLRNVALSRPYMHDGRFTTLEAVLDHYSSGIVPSATLDTILTNGIQLSADEKAAMVAFLKTLSDTTFTKDTLFSEPKK
jgi:cytochrome c peroxidase